MLLLVTTGDFKEYLDPSFHFLIWELSRNCDLIAFYESGNIKDILNELKDKPDFILINEPGEINTPAITGLDSLSIPYAVYLHDLHHDSCKEALQDGKVSYVFTRYRDQFRNWFPQYMDKMYWLPHHINTNIFRDYKLPKTIDYLLMGAVHDYVYSLRYKMLERMKNLPGFVYHHHPGYRNFSQKEKSELYIGAKYAREINRAKIFLTCDSIYQYPVMKYYEVLACNTLLLAPSSPELRDLGFIPGVHFVAVDENDFEEKARYYLEHEKERLLIAQQGYQMVRKKHSTTRRAEQLHDILKQIKGDE